MNRRDFTRPIAAYVHALTEASVSVLHIDLNCQYRSFETGSRRLLVSGSGRA